MTNIRTYLENNVLLFDGSMGVYYHNRYPDGSRCELANLSHPERILEIHREYIEAGAKAIKTNSFSANTNALGCPFSVVKEILTTSWSLAQKATEGTDVFVFADIGPILGLDADENEYAQIVDTFIELGAKNFLFETFTDLTVLPELAARIKKAIPDAFILVSFSAFPEGFTSSGQDVRTLLRETDACPDIDAAGLNCVSGPAHLLKLIKHLKHQPKILSVMPNAGYPSIVRGQTLYGGKPDYFAFRTSQMCSHGARIIGGCCGTTPEFIRQTARFLADPDGSQPTGSPEEEETPKPAPIIHYENRLSDKLNEGKRVIAVELDPPADASIDFFVNGAKRLRDAGADAITIADCPIARARADSSMLAAKLHRELGIDPIPHMTCRDRNINATRALLLGLSIENVHNVLLVTGDPIPSSEREQIKGVFSFNSATLASYVRTLAEDGELAPFRIYGALNVNSLNFQSELQRAVKKENAGVNGFLTQPVFTDQAFENLKLAHETLKSPILGGIYPLVSERNAMFMNNEVSGVEIPEDIIHRYHGLDKAGAEDVALEISVENALRMKDITAGWYLMTPFKRIALMERILKRLREL